MTLTIIRKGSLAIALCGALITCEPAAYADEKPLVVAFNNEPESTDPLLAPTIPTTAPLMENVIEPLVGLNNDGKPRETVATWTQKDGGKILEFRIKPGLVFQSGDPLTPADILFSHTRAMTSSYYRSAMSDLAKVEIFGNDGIRFTFNRPCLSMIIANQLYVESKAYHDRVGEAAFVAMPMGTGPYRLVKYVAGEGADLEAFDRYAGQKPWAKRVRAVFVKDNTTRVAMLRAGEADLITGVPYKEVRGLKAAGFGISESDNFPTITINFQTLNKSTPWSDRRVRAAIAHAVDSQAIVQGLFAGIPKRYAMLGPTEVGYDPSLKLYDYDPALAKTLLAQAGYPKGFSMPLGYSVSTFYGVKETAEAVTLYLRAVGINAVVQSEDLQKTVARVRAEKNDTNFQYVWIQPKTVANYSDPSMALALGFATRTPTAVYAPSNKAEFDRLDMLAETTFDEKERAGYSRAAFKMMYDDLAFIPLWSAVTVYAMRSGLSFVPVQTSFPRLPLLNVAPTTSAR
jgi:peptide/nickel transport system substrate-binding protein